MFTCVYNQTVKKYDILGFVYSEGCRFGSDWFYLSLVPFSFDRLSENRYKIGQHPASLLVLPLYKEYGDEFEKSLILCLLGCY